MGIAATPGGARDLRPRGRLRPLVVGLGLVGLLAPAPAAPAERFRPATFDLAAARDARDLEVVEVAASRRVTDGVTVREVRFTSRAWDARGRSRPIRIQAFLAVPPGVYPPHGKPVVITAAGLGAHATPEAAGEICRNLDVVALAISAPGQGASEGEGVTPEDARPLFATVPDVRGSWLYAYTYALLRAITLAQEVPEADPQAVVGPPPTPPPPGRRGGPPRPPPFFGGFGGGARGWFLQPPPTPPWQGGWHPSCCDGSCQTRHGDAPAPCSFVVLIPDARRRPWFPTSPTRRTS